MYSMVSAVKNIASIAYLKAAKKVDVKISHHKKMWVSPL